MDNKFKNFFKKSEIINANSGFHKFNIDIQKNIKNKKNSNLILVTSINPTPTGEGKTTTLIGLNDCMNYFGRKSLACLREPSMGPYFGIKGSATGSGKNSLLNPDKINSCFTGDFFAIETANNLIVTILENLIYFQEDNDIDIETISWKRCIDINDRSLREISYKIKDKNIKAEFTITAASKLMALFCLSKNKEDFIIKLENTIIAKTKNDKDIYVKDLKIKDALISIMDDALNPNIVLSSYKNPVLIHGGPFANIAHGCNSFIATNVALSKANFVFTEAGFGADLGAEKFINIKCREFNIKPSLAIITVTVKALKYHGGVKLDDLNTPNLQAIEKGFSNLEKHVESIKSFNLPFCVVINKFNNDTNQELNLLKKLCLKKQIDCEISTTWQNGPSKNLKLVKLIERNISKNYKINFTYDLKDDSILKMEKVAKIIYGAEGINLSNKAKAKLEHYKNQIKDYYICFAKTPFSISSNPNLLGRPKNFYIDIDDFEINSAVKFLIPLTSKIFMMPGLSREPNAQRIKYNAKK